MKMQLIRKRFWHRLPFFFVFCGYGDRPDHILTFDQPVILVGASPVPVDSVLSLLPAAWPLIAAMGADMLLDLGRRPDMVIGDMDQPARC